MFVIVKLQFVLFKSKWKRHKWECKNKFFVFGVFFKFQLWQSLYAVAAMILGYVAKLLAPLLGFRV